MPCSFVSEGRPPFPGNSAGDHGRRRRWCVFARCAALCRPAVRFCVCADCARVQRRHGARRVRAQVCPSRGGCLIPRRAASATARRAAAAQRRRPPPALLPHGRLHDARRRSARGSLARAGLSPRSAHSPRARRSLTRAPLPAWRTLPAHRLRRACRRRAGAATLRRCACSCARTPPRTRRCCCLARRARAPLCRGTTRRTSWTPQPGAACAGSTCAGRSPHDSAFRASGLPLAPPTLILRLLTRARVVPTQGGCV
jgi:hypothetical protein